jgi:hypothetical protein
MNTSKCKDNDHVCLFVSFRLNGKNPTHACTPNKTMFKQRTFAKIIKFVANTTITHD